MSNQQILEKAIQKAIDNGWEQGTELLEADYIDSVFEDYKIAHPYFAVTHDTGVNLEAIIFNHDFAKALWGEARDITSYKYYLEGEYFDDKTPEEYQEIVNTDEADNHWEQYVPVYKNKGWKYHLMQMVIAEDPIKYLGENI